MMGNKPSEAEQYITSQYMRSDESKRASTLMQIPEGKFVSMDHKKKQYFEMSFEDMTSMAESMTANMQESWQESKEEMEEEGANVDVKFDVSVTDLGESQKIAGYKANRKLLQVEVQYTAEDQQTGEQGSGNFYSLTEMWVSNEAPGQDIIKAFGENYAKKMGEAFGGSQSGFANMASMMGDERMGAAMGKVAEEMTKLEGVALKTISYFVLVPDGKELDVDAVINKKETKKKKRRRGLGSLAKNALKSQGINVGGDDGEAQAQQEVKEQTLLSTSETVYTLIEVVGDDESRFKVPGKYKQIDAPTYMQMEDQ